MLVLCTSRGGVVFEWGVMVLVLCSSGGVVFE